MAPAHYPMVATSGPLSIAMTILVPNVATNREVRCVVSTVHNRHRHFTQRPDLLAKVSDTFDISCCPAEVV